MAAGRREAGKEADTAHIALVGSWERSAWLGGRGPDCFSPPSGGREAGTVRSVEGPLRVAEERWCSVATGAHGNRANGKENHQAWPDFPGLLPVALGHFKAREAKITPIALRGAAGGAGGWGAGEAIDPTAEVTHLVKSCQAVLETKSFLPGTQHYLSPNAQAYSDCFG